MRHLNFMHSPPTLDRTHDLVGRERVNHLRQLKMVKQNRELIEVKDVYRWILAQLSMGYVLEIKLKSLGSIPNEVVDVSHTRTKQLFNYFWLHWLSHLFNQVYNLQKFRDFHEHSVLKIGLVILHNFTYITHILHLLSSDTSDNINSVIMLIVLD